MDTAAFIKVKEKITDNCRRIIVGKDETIEQILVCLVASGHILLEDVPGTGKTMLLRAFARSIGGEFRRIQFTPDLLPSDRPGPLFTNLVLADEINRATPRSQSALLEVMEEKQISVDGQSYPMREPYMVMATQNPLESFGTFPLPEAQMDRFFMRLKLGYMTREEEISVLRRRDSKELLNELSCVVSAEEIDALRRGYSAVRVSDDIAAYIMDIVEATRSNEKIANGVSARGSLALYRASQIYAAMQGRDYVIPEDVKREALCVLPHRVLLVSSSHSDPVRFIAALLEEIEVPLEKV